MIKRTSLNLDLALVAMAKDVLGTKETTETIHRALDEVVRQARRKRLAARRFEFSNVDLEEIRRPRTDGTDPVGVRSRPSSDVPG